MTKRINVCIVGAGRIGGVHFENLAFRIPQANPSMVVDLLSASAQSIAQQVEGARGVSDLRLALEDETIEAVVICSSTESHLDLIEAAAAAGKHIFCEKPIALSLGDIDRALHAVETAGVRLQVGFNRRFDPNYRRVRRAIEQGEIGEPHMLHIVSRDPAPPPIDYVRRSGGLFLDMTIHDFDMARYLIGSEVEEVYAAGAVRVDPAIGEAGDIDTAVILLRFENGVLGTIENSRMAAYGYDQRVEVFGSGGSAQADNQYPNTVTVSSAHDIARDLPLQFFVERYADSYLAEMQAFIDAILADEPVAVDGRDGRMSAVIGMAARRSYVEHRPVPIREIQSDVPSARVE